MLLKTRSRFAFLLLLFAGLGFACVAVEFPEPQAPEDEPELDSAGSSLQGQEPGLQLATELLERWRDELEREQADFQGWSSDLRDQRAELESDRFDLEQGRHDLEEEWTALRDERNDLMNRRIELERAQAQRFDDRHLSVGSSGDARVEPVPVPARAQAVIIERALGQLALRELPRESPPEPEEEVEEEFIDEPVLGYEASDEDSLEYADAEFDSSFLEAAGQLSAGEVPTPSGPAPQSSEREAALTIYCQREMVEGVQYDIAAFVSTALDRAELQEVTVREASANRAGVDVTTAQLNTSDYKVLVTDRVQVVLELPPGQFELVSAPKRPERKLGEWDTQDWHWTVIPRTTVDQVLVFKVLRWDEANERWKQAGSSQTFPVKVRMSFEVLSASTWGFLSHNPEYLLSQILIPVAAFLVGRRRAKRKEPKAAVEA